MLIKLVLFMHTHFQYYSVSSVYILPIWLLILINRLRRKLPPTYCLTLWFTYEFPKSLGKYRIALSEDSKRGRNYSLYKLGEHEKLKDDWRFVISILSTHPRKIQRTRKRHELHGHQEIPALDHVQWIYKKVQVKGSVLLEKIDISLPE